MPQLLRLARDIAQSCGCGAGCLSCVLDPQCTEHNVVIDKAAATLILQAAVARLP